MLKFQFKNWSDVFSSQNNYKVSFQINQLVSKSDQIQILVLKH